MEEDINQKKWEALPRGAILSACIGKHVQYVGLADRRAQGIIAINTFIIPIALTGLGQAQYTHAATIAIVTALAVIAFAILSLYPKRYTHRGHNHENLLHFSDIQDLPEAEYLELMRTATADPGELTKMAATDIHHLSQHILKCKMQWLKVSYFVFLGGYSVAVLSMLV